MTEKHHVFFGGCVVIYGPQYSNNIPILWIMFYEDWWAPHAQVVIVIVQLLQGPSLDST